MRGKMRMERVIAGLMIGLGLGALVAGAASAADLVPPPVQSTVEGADTAGGAAAATE